MIKHLENLKDFTKEIASGNVVVDFFASWCGPCRIMGRVLEEIEAKFPDITFLKIDTDSFQELAIEHGVVSIPTLVAYKNGEQIQFTTSTGSKHDILLGIQDTDYFSDILSNTF